MTTANCKACGAKIFFVPTAGGKQMPLDAQSDIAGNVVIVEGNVVINPPADFGGQRFAAHWATCPTADKFRRGR